MIEEIDFKQMMRKRVLIWTFFSVSQVAAIPIMIVALVHLNWLIAIPCMALVVFNCIGIPIGWAKIGAMAHDAKIVRVINRDKVFHINDLAVMFNYKNREMKERVVKLIGKGYLRGYKFNDIGVELIFINDESIHKGLCKYCGAPLPRRAEVCIYCGGQVERKAGQ